MSATSLTSAEQVEPASSSQSAGERSRPGVVPMPESYPATPLPPLVEGRHGLFQLRNCCCQAVCAAAVVLVMLSVASTTLGRLSYRGGAGRGNESHAAVSSTQRVPVSAPETTASIPAVTSAVRGAAVSVTQPPSGALGAVSATPTLLSGAQALSSVTWPSQQEQEEEAEQTAAGTTKPEQPNG